MSAPTPVRAAWTRLSTWTAAYERSVGPPMLGVIPSTLAADRAVVEAWVMSEPAGDVAAALERIRVDDYGVRWTTWTDARAQRNADLALLAPELPPTVGVFHD